VGVKRGGGGETGRVKWETEKSKAPEKSGCTHNFPGDAQEGMQMGEKRGRKLEDQLLGRRIDTAHRRNHERKHPKEKMRTKKGGGF